MRARVVPWLVVPVVVPGVVGVACGAGAAVFLALLQCVGALRHAHPAFVWALPACGVVVGAALGRFASSVRGGTSLVLDTIHEDGPRLPWRMGPLVVVGTLLTHLCGGSAGREGTAVQMGASIGDGVASIVAFTSWRRRAAILAGIAGGFGAVFGTPWAAALFAVEVLAIGRLEVSAIVPAVVAALVGDAVARALGATHTSFPLVAPHAITPALCLRWVAFAVVVAVVVVAFLRLTQAIRDVLARRVSSLPARLAIGGVVVVALWQASGTDAYLGLGADTIRASFDDVAIPPWAFVAKLVFTAVTIGAGFVGGEVTPLFFVGATLGHACAPLLHVSTSMAAAVGMAAVFATAANTPLALSVMAVELCGVAVAPHVLWVCVVAWVCVGHRGLYGAQRVVRLKSGRKLAVAHPLRAWSTAASPIVSSSTQAPPDAPPAQEPARARQAS